MTARRLIHRLATGQQPHVDGRIDMNPSNDTRGPGAVYLDRRKVVAVPMNPLSSHLLNVFIYSSFETLPDSDVRHEIANFN